jgi:hypothetical protein
MSKKKQTQDFQLEVYNPPAWLVEALQIARDLAIIRGFDEESERISEDFRHRCHEAAEVALTIARLRKERQRVGFMPLSLADYIQGLAKVAGISLSYVLKWLDISDLSQPKPDSARAFARLAQELGLSLREILIHVRISFAGGLDFAPIPVLIAHRRSVDTRRSQLEECESVLGQLESEYDAKFLSDLRHIESEIRAAYEEHEKTTD